MRHIYESITEDLIEAIKPALHTAFDDAVFFALERAKLAVTELCKKKGVDDSTIHHIERAIIDKSNY